jgi:hypothetical protein
MNRYVETNNTTGMIIDDSYDFFVFAPIVNNNMRGDAAFKYFENNLFIMRMTKNILKH